MTSATNLSKPKGIQHVPLVNRYQPLITPKFNLYLNRRFLKKDEATIVPNEDVHGLDSENAIRISTYTNALYVGFLKMIEEFFGIRMIRTMHFISSSDNKILTMHFRESDMQNVKKIFEKFFDKETVVYVRSSEGCYYPTRLWIKEPDVSYIPPDKKR